MLDFDSEPEMVGREENLEELQAFLEMATDGFGSTVLLSGEAGIGKTRLVEELKNDAQSKGFQVLSGYSLYESLTPYMPFEEALKSGGLEHLFAEESPRMEGIYLVTRTGLLIKEIIREETELDPDLFASMLTTVGDFVRDTLSQLRGEETQDTLNKLGYGDYTILIEGGVNIYLAAILTGGENEFLIDDLRDVLRAVDKRYRTVLEKWDGDEEKVRGIESLLRPLISSGKYEGVYYGREDPKSRRSLLFENVALGLTRQTQTAPTLLCLEDLQWADPSSLALMHYVARNTRKCRLLILGTFRPEDISVEEGEYHPLVGTMQLMSREELFKRLELGRLPKESTMRLLSSLLGDVGFSSEFQDRIFKETEGNPLYIIELIKLLVDEQAIRDSDGAWKPERNLDEINIPSKIYDVISRRLSRVEKEDRKVLDYACVIGEIFTSETLAEALKLERVRLLERLRVLEKRHKLVHTHDGGYRFDHAKVREVLYEEIPQELKNEYHSIVANSIEKLYKDNLDDVIGDLAFHYYHSRNREKARTYLIIVAEKAKEEYSNDEAIRFYGEALEFEEDLEKRMELLMNLGRVYQLIGDLDRSLECFENALELAKNERKKAMLLATIGDIHETKGDYDEALNIYNEAMQCVKAERCEEEATAFSGLGVVYWSRGDYERALEYHHKALEIVQEIGDSLGVANSLLNIGNVHLQKGELEPAFEYYRDSAKKKMELGDQRGVAQALSNIGAIHILRGELERAFENFRETLLIFERIGDQQGIAYTLNNIGVLHEKWSDYDEALENYRKSLDMVERIGDERTIASTLHNIGAVHKYVGEYDEALDHFGRSLEISERIGFQMGMAFNFCGLAETHLRKKEMDKAIDFCNRAFELSNEIGAKEFVAESKKIFGMIFREMRNWEEAIENFRDCVEMCREIGREKELGESYYEFGLMWARKGEVNNARNILNNAVEIFDKLKLKRESRDVRDALSNLSDVAK